MNPYKYSVSLRIFHPYIDPDDITEQIKILPTRKWKAGEPRSTPTGTKINGKYDNSYWASSLTGKGHFDSKSSRLEEYLHGMNKEL